MKKIAIVYGTLVCGGVEKALLTMLRRFDYSKYDITLLVEHDDGPLQNLVDTRVNVRKWEQKNSIKYTTYLKQLCAKREFRAVLVSIWYRLLAHLFNKDIQRNVKYSYESQNVEKKRFKEQFDIVISYQALSYWHLLYARNYIMAKKYICWIHGNMKYLEKEYTVMLPKIFNWFDRFVCVSNSVKESFLYFSPKLGKKTTVIYNLFDINGIQESAKQPIIETMDGLTFTTVGRISPEKGQLMIPMIAKELLNLGYTFKWYVVGDGSDMEQLKKSVEELSLKDVVILTGMKENPYPYIKNCSLYIQPSYTEGFCLSTFEAKILGRHIVVTDVPGMREQFAENEAIFCVPTVPSLVNGIQRALETIDLPVPYKKVTDEFNQEQLRKIDKILS